MVESLDIQADSNNNSKSQVTVTHTMSRHPGTPHTTYSAIIALYRRRTGNEGGVQTVALEWCTQVGLSHVVALKSKLFLLPLGRNNKEIDFNCTLQLSYCTWKRRWRRKRVRRRWSRQRRHRCCRSRACADCRNRPVCVQSDSMQCDAMQS